LKHDRAASSLGSELESMLSCTGSMSFPLIVTTAGLREDGVPEEAAGIAVETAVELVTTWTVEAASTTVGLREDRFPEEATGIAVGTAVELVS